MEINNDTCIYDMIDITTFMRSTFIVSGNYKPGNRRIIALGYIATITYQSLTAPRSLEELVLKVVNVFFGCMRVATAIMSGIAVGELSLYRYSSVISAAVFIIANRAIAFTQNSVNANYLSNRS